MSAPDKTRRLRLPVLMLVLTLVVGGVTGTALARSGNHHVKRVKIVGNPKAGAKVFKTTCGVCHKMKAAKTVGTIGPNLDVTARRLTEAKIIKAISKGGASIMTKKALAKYPTRMIAYKGSLSVKVIRNVAAYVYVSTHKKKK